MISSSARRRARDPLANVYPWYALIELSSQANDGLRAVLEEILAEGLERRLIADAAIADNLEQSQAFWRLREMFGEVQRHEGGSIKHDISVPVAAVPAFIAHANAAVTALVPGARPLPFGHLGDGNIHYNVAQPVGAAKADYLKRWDEMNAVVFDIVAKLGGSISAEHGIGVMKREILPSEGPGRLEIMLRSRRARHEQHPQSRQLLSNNDGGRVFPGAAFAMAPILHCPMAATWRRRLHQDDRSLGYDRADTSCSCNRSSGAGSISALAVCASTFGSRAKGQGLGSSITGMRSWICAIGRLAAVVTIAALSISSPFGPLHVSHSPAKATGPPPLRLT